jgi:hypothetical protein
MHQVLTRTPQDTTPHAVLRRVGDPSLIRHVLYVIKENRTYDQVLGDLRRGTVIGPSSSSVGT